MKLKELLNEVVKTTHEKNTRDVKKVTDAGELIAKLGAISSGEQASAWGAKAKGTPTKAVVTALDATNKAWEALDAAPQNTPERATARDEWKTIGGKLCLTLDKIMDASIEKAQKAGNRIRRTPIKNILTAMEFANAWVSKA